MNNIFRLVWNRTLGCLVVASEAAKSRHKSSINGQPVVQEPAKQSHLFVLKPLLLSTAVMLGSVFFVLNPVHAYTAAGADACADPSNFKIGIGSGARACSEAAIAIGGNAGAAPGVSTENTVAIGRNSAAINVINGGGNNQAGVAIGFNAITYGGVAIGDLAQGSLNSPSVAIGSGSEALGNFSIAIGTHEHQRTQANFNQSTAVGSNAIAGAIGASSFGRQASATGTSATALGRNSIAAGDSSLAVGEQSSASVQFANAIGIQSQASGVGATALGPAAQATVESSLAIGRRAEAAGVQSTSIGLDASATDTDAIAMGTNAEASAANAIAIGKDSVASGVDTGAIGRGAVATGSWAVGTGAAASNGGQAFGEFSTASGNNSSAYGQTATATGNLSSALGTQATAQGDSSTAVGFEAEAVGDKSYAGGYQSKALAAGSSAIGTGVEASAEGAVVIGRDSTASGFQSFAVGHNTNASGQDAVSVGTASKAEGLSSIAISRGAFALDDYATALGGESNANAIYSTAIGSFSTAGAESSTAIGDASNATLEDSVALGSDSVADTAAGINGYIPFGATAADTTAINNTIATRAAVDVGSRQITSVAAGTDDDDAVNVSQLIAAQSDVAAGTNIADVTASENPDGGTIYTVNADGASVSAGDGVDVTPAGPDANNVTDYEVALNQTTKDSLDLADNALQEVVTQVDGTDVKTLTKGDNNANFISGKNIALSDDGAGGIEVATLDNVTFTDVQTDTLTAGPVNIDAAGIDAGSTTISSVAPGIAGTDAVNVNQLDDAAAASKTEVTGGTNIAGVTKATGANGQDIYTVNADGASVSAGDGVDVTPAGPDANNVTDYEVALNQATKDSLVLADSALQTVVTQIDGVDIKTIDENDNVANFVTGDNVVLSDETGSIRIATADNVTFTDVQTDTLTAGPVNIDAAGIDAGSTTISSVAPGIAGTDAVNVNQLDAAAAASKTEVTGGTNIAGVTKATGANGQDIYTVDANGASVSAGDGVDVTPAGPDANNITDYEVALNQATKDSLVLADSALQTVVTQIDGVDVKTIDENDNVANFVTGQNITLSDDGAGSIEIATVDSPQFGNVTINTSGGDTINNLSNTTFDPDNFTSGQAASEDQLKQVSDVANAGWNVQTNGDTATNVAPGDTVQFLDGDNIDITRNGMDITVATAPDLTADSVTINGGPVINNTGIDMGGDTITNVGAPVNNTDAANKQYVDENRVRYYSVNDVPTNQANFNNDGATGANALAAGVAASATEENATAVGTSAAATGAGSTAIGYASKAQGANSFALGENATSSAENSLSMGADSTANTRYSTAIGRATNAQGQGSIALGGGTAADAANASGTGAIAIGGYGAVGVGGANANQNYAVALGSGAQAAASEGDVALGSGSQTAPASQVSQATIGSTTYSGFAGSTPTSVVSVGSAGAERQITNVAAGRITNTSTDAINGSQLFSVVDTGFKLSADNGLEDTVKLGETVNYTNDDGNLVATVRNNEVVYDLADTIDAETINIINGPTLNDNGISMGGNTITNLGDGIADGDAVNVSQLKAAETEVAAGTNVASVVETTGADGQGIYIVNADGATVSAGSTAVAVTPTGPDANNVTDYAVDLSQDSKNSLTLADTSLQEIVTQIDGVGVKTLTKGDNTANFVTGQNIALSDDGAGGIEIATVDSPQFGNVTINQGGGDTINNLSNTTFDPDNFTSGQAASEDQLKQVSDVANAGWNLTANGEATGENIAPGETADFTQGDNIVITRTGNSIEVATTPDLIADSVTITNGPTLNDNGIDMGGDTITNLGDPVNNTDAANKQYVDQTETDLINLGMRFTGNDATAGDVQRNLGETLAITGEATAAGTYSGTNLRTVTDPASGAIKLEMADSPQFGNVTINEGGGDTINNLSNTTFDPDNFTSGQAASEDQLKQVSDVANAGWDVQTNGDTATNVAPGDTVQFLDGKNIAITRNGTDITVATADDVDFDSVSITNGPTLNDDGIDMGGDTITNLGDPINGGDALNLKYFDENRTRYYSVNDGGTIGGNYNNDGATGLNAIASGVDASASGNGAVAMGFGASAPIRDSLALGSGSVVDRALAPDSGFIPAGSATIEFNTTDKELLGAISVGDNDSYRQITNVADGTEAQDAVTVRQLQGAVGSVVESGTKYFRANSTQPDSAAVGEDSIAVGPTTVTNGDNGIGMGNGAIVGQMAPGGTAIGNNAEVLLSDGIALGTNARSEAQQGIALGAGATVSHDQSVALGSNSSTEDAVATSGITIAGDSYTFAGTTPDSTVSVGSAGNERTLTNVAAGRVSETSTDAINGSQLFATNKAIEEVNTLAGAGWNVQANGDTATNVAPGETVQFLDGDNIDITRNGTDITVVTAPDLTADSVTINDGPVINNTGIDMGGDIITNLGDPVNNTDAANKQYVDQTETDLINLGMRFTGNDATAGDVQRNLGETLAITGEATAAGTYSGTNLRTVTDPASGAIKLEMADSPQFGNVTINEGGGDTINNLSNTTFDPDNFTSGQAASEDQLKQVSDVANAGWNLTANGEANGENIAPGETADFTQGDNIVITRTGNSIEVATTPDLIADSVTITNGPTLNDNGIDMGGDTITNLGDPVNNTDAANKQYVDQTETDLINLGMRFTGNDATAGDVQRNLGETLAITGEATAAGTYSGTNLRTVTDPASGAIKLEMADSPQFGNVTINEGGGDTINNLSNTTFDPDNFTSGQAASEDQLKQVSDVANAGWNVQANGDTATNVAPGDTVQFLNGKNIAITRNGTDITVATADDVDFDSVSITNGPTLNDTGIDMGGDTITNLGDPINGGDALNLKYFDENRTRYYSVNDGGTIGGNYDNDGAIGLNAIASGVDASASGDGALAMGFGASAPIRDSLALGSGSVVDRALAPDSGFIPAGSATIEFNTTDKELLGAISVGDNDSYRQITNVADGTEAQDAVTVRQLQGAVGSVVESGTKYFRANSTQPDSAAVGEDSIAVGPTTVTNGDNGIGMGNGAIVGQMAPGGTAIGNNAEVLLSDGIALGTNARSEAQQGIALGAGATVSHDQSVALGSNSSTEDAVATSGITIAGDSYTFAGTTPDSTVSVGSAGNERTLTNVAAGRVSETSTDAINGSQLFASNQAIEEVSKVANTGWNVQANGDTATNVAPGETVQFLDGDNIDITRNGTDITVATVASPQFGNVTVNTAGNDTINNLSNTTFDPDNFTSGQAASEDQLKQVSDVANAGWNVQANGDIATNVAPGETVQFLDGDNIAITRTGNSIEVATTPDLTADSVIINGGPVINNTGIDMGGDTITNLGDPVNNTDAANKQYVDQTETDLINLGMRFTGNDATAGDVQRNLGETLAITGEATAAGTYSGTNLRTVTDPASGAIKLEMADSPQFGNVTINEGGGDTINNLSNTTFDPDNFTSGQAASEDQLKQVSDIANAGWNVQANGDIATNVAPGDTVQFLDGKNIAITRNGTDITVATADDVDFDSVSITNGPTLNDDGIDMGGDTITNLGDPINGGDALNLKYFDENRTRYYSVNDGGTIGGNYNNDGATGLNAIASGVDASASGNGAVAMGFGASAPIRDSLALGSGSVVDRALAPDSGFIPAGSATIEFNTTDKELLGAISVGDNDSYRQITNVADGTEAQDAVTVRQLQGAVGSVVESGTKYFRANSTQPDSAAVGEDSIAVGPTTVTNGDNGIGMGNGAIVGQMAPGGTAIGNNAEVLLSDGIALGTNARSEAQQGIALGAGATVSHDQSVALGSNSSTEDAVATSGVTIAGDSYTFAGTTPDSTVSVGSAGNERTLTNVAAGRVSETSTDAINGSQLFASNQAIEEVAATASAGWNLSTQDQGAENIVPDGEVNLRNEDGNLSITQATANSREEVTFALASDITVDNSLTVGIDGPEISETGITNLAPGEISEQSTDAINGSQLYETNEWLQNLDNSVTNIVGDVANGQGIRYVRTNDDGLPLSDAFAQAQGSTAVGYEAEASADRALALGYQAMAAHQGSVALGEGARTDEAVGTATIEIGGETYTFAGISPVATVSVGSAGAERTMTNVAAGRINANSTDAINGSQLYITNQVLEGLNNRVNSIEANVTDINTQIEEGDIIAGGGGVQYNKNGDGETDSSSITLEGDGGTTITNVADGDLSPDSSDAVTGGQLYETNTATTSNTVNIADNRQQINQNTTQINTNTSQINTNTDAIADIGKTVGQGLSFSADEGEVVNRQLGDTVAITGDGNITTRTTGDGVQVTLNREIAVDSVTTGNTTLSNDGVRIEGGPSMTLGGIDMNGTRLSNLAPGEADGDAVNMGQMRALGQQFQGEINSLNNRLDGVERDANAGTASALAASSVPQAWRSGESMIAVGAGTYGGESAVSVGISRLSDNGRWIIQGKVTGDSQNNFGAGVGAGWHW